MKNTLLLIFFLLSNEISSQYVVESPYLLNPELIISYVDSCAEFWFDAYDPVNGGFYTNIDKFGNLIVNWGTNKDMMTQSRNAYGYARAFMLTGNELYLEKARQALDFMYDHAWDDLNGGWINNINRFGIPVNPTDNKSAFHQHYALVGILAYYEATLDTLDFNWLMKGFSSNEINLWDPDPVYYGYYDYSSYNWSAKHGKSFNATVDALTTHLIYLYLMTGEDTYKERMLQMINNIEDYLVESMQGQAIGFVELYDNHWNWDNSNTMTIMGHILKTAWCLGRVQQLIPGSNFVTSAEELLDDVLAKGYDHELGGPYKDYNRVNGQMLMWGNPDTAKAWWQMEQAIVAGLMFYDITNDDKYLKMADETLNFYMNYFVDHEYGEVYENRTRYGDETWGEHKGNGNKAAYHSIETGYYVYLYGKLFYKNEPVELYYDFAPSDNSREIKLTPLSIADDRLKIKEVFKDGSAYNDFSAVARTVYIPSGTGGVFKVVFEPAEVTEVAIENPAPNEFVLNQNYPNPFNPTTTISFNLPSAAHVDLELYDALGRRVASIIDSYLEEGNHSVIFSGENLASGIYIYILNSGGKHLTKKMILIK